MKQAGRAFALSLTLGASGCSPPEPTELSLHGVAYAFPEHDIRGAVLPPHVGSRLFLRLAPPGTSYHLILDERSHYSPNKLGPDVPTIALLNDNRFWSFSLIPGRHGPIVCMSEMQHFNCGFRVNDGPVRWSVLFDRDQLSQVDAIRTQAQEAIQRHRR